MRFILVGIFIIFWGPMSAGDLDFSQLKVPATFENAAMEAIQKYPELQGVNIEIVFRNIKTTMAARPRFFSIFGDKRKYRIYIDTKVHKHNGILLSDATYNAQVGIFGHEFAHILDYETKTGKEVVYDGFRFLAKHNIGLYEKYIDYITIERGLGTQLEEWARFVLHTSNASDKYKSFKKKHYFSAQEISEIRHICSSAHS